GKTYDGTTAASWASQDLRLLGIIAGDDVSLDAIPTFGDAGAGADKLVGLGAGSSLHGVDAGNYQLSLVGAPTAAAEIAPAPLSVMARDARRTYDATAFSGGNGVDNQHFVNGETEAVLGGGLLYGGTAQGAVNAGVYNDHRIGLSSSIIRCPSSRP
ncbi:MAG: YDG domain-containing protein, partial [Dehalococcoidia bacterium]|nr:YDG domain-containing protein [Dehalococcoidia bacterium]